MMLLIIVVHQIGKYYWYIAIFSTIFIYKNQFQSTHEDKKAGILRVESNVAATTNLPGSNAASSGSSRRKSSRSSLVAQEAISPAPSADRLSVTFAMDDGTNIKFQLMFQNQHNIIIWNDKN